MRLGLFQSRHRCVWWPVFFLIVGLAINPFLFFSLSWANTQPAPPSLTSYSSSPLPGIPKEQDGPFQVWQEKNKYFLVVAVNETGVKGTELPFAAVDGRKVSEGLENLGYTQLATLIGKDASLPSFRKWLKEIRTLPDNSTVIVYYSGHGATDETDPDRDLWVQLYGQEALGAQEGMSVTEIIKRARGTDWEGDLVLIMDACYSGQALLSRALSLDLLGAKTVIFTSSKETQNSYSVDIPLGDKMSAFTYSLLQGLGPEWSSADANEDGILQFGEIRRFTQLKLAKFKEEARLDIYMKPSLLWAERDDLFLAYRRDKVRRWDTTDRQLLNLVALEKTLIPDDSPHPQVSSKSPNMAKGISATRKIPHTPYALGLLALSQGQLGKARSSFLEAEAKEEQRSEGHSQEDQQQILAKEKLGRIYLALGRTETYAGNFPTAVRWYEKVAEHYPSRDPRRLNEIGQAFSRGGLVDKAASFIKQAFYFAEEALDLTRKGVPIGTESVELFGSLLSRTMHALAGLISPKELDEFSKRYQKSLELQKQLLGERNPIIAEGVEELAVSFLKQGKFSEAEPLLQNAMEQGFPTFLGNTSNLGLLRSHQQEYTRAKKLYQGALMIAEEVFGDQPSPITATLYSNLGEIDLALKNFPNAKDRFSKALQIFQNLDALDYHAIAIVKYNLGLVHLKLGSSFDEAEAYFDAAVTTARKYLREDDKTTTKKIYSGSIEALRRMGRDERALALEKEYKER
ncbi:MAG: tetratricopeptide repeat protein [Nitrospirae bacterium]|nr:tetratricopeptide repeat protein [Nitrospirota bacterium]